MTPSPIVELNRAIALGMLFGPEAGLRLVDALAEDPALAGYHLLPSVRGDFLFKLGRFDEAREPSSSGRRGWRGMRGNGRCWRRGRWSAGRSTATSKAIEQTPSLQFQLTCLLSTSWADDD